MKKVKRYGHILKRVHEQEVSLGMEGRSVVKISISFQIDVWLRKHRWNLLFMIIIMMVPLTSMASVAIYAVGWAEQTPQVERY